MSDNVTNKSSHFYSDYSKYKLEKKGSSNSKKREKSGASVYSTRFPIKRTENYPTTDQPMFSTLVHVPLRISNYSRGG